MVSGDIEKRLWAAADQLWANTGLKPSQFSTPVLGLIFLRYAEKRFAEAEGRIGPVGSGNRRKISKADYDAEGVIFLGVGNSPAACLISGCAGGRSARY